MQLGGVDLSNVDITQPFSVDFSIPANASIAVKRAALSRARAAFEAFETVKRRWHIQLDLNLVNHGRCITYIFPLGPVAQ
jgi:hypothetical protein